MTGVCAHSGVLSFDGGSKGVQGVGFDGSFLFIYIYVHRCDIGCRSVVCRRVGEKSILSSCIQLLFKKRECGVQAGAISGEKQTEDHVS